MRRSLLGFNLLPNSFAGRVLGSGFGVYDCDDVFVEYETCLGSRNSLSDAGEKLQSLIAEAGYGCW